MTNKTPFTCTICHQPAENPYLCFDRRVESAYASTRDGKPVTSIKIAVRQTMFMYCSHQCWQAHQPSLAGELQLKSTYPKFSLITPCSRCGAAVNRTQHYVNYSISEMNLKHIEPYLMAQCVDDHDFAVLCLDCEDGGLPEAEEQTRTTNDERGVSV